MHCTAWLSTRLEKPRNTKRVDDNAMAEIDQREFQPSQMLRSGGPDMEIHQIIAPCASCNITTGCDPTSAKKWKNVVRLWCQMILKKSHIASERSYFCYLPGGLAPKKTAFSKCLYFYYIVCIFLNRQAYNLLVKLNRSQYAQSSVHPTSIISGQQASKHALF